MKPWRLAAILAALAILVPPASATTVAADPTLNPAPIAEKQLVPPDPSVVVTTIRHTPQPNSFSGDASASPLNVVGQYTCVVGSVKNVMYYAAKYSPTNINAVTGYVPYVRDLYPCTESLGFLLSDSFINGANLQGSGGNIVQTGYYKKDGSGLMFWYTPQDTCGGCFTSWPDSGFYPRVGDYVRFSVTPNGSYWKIDIYDVTIGYEEYVNITKSFSTGFAWWAAETDNTSTVLDVPINYPSAWVYNWLYSTNGGSSWTNAGQLSGQLNDQSASSFYHGAVSTYSGQWGLYAWTTAH